MGENGSGKSTLLEAVAAASGFNPEGGSVNLRLSSVDAHSGLYGRLKLIPGPARPRDGYFLRAESFYDMATAIDEADEDHTLTPGYGGKSPHRQSRGEGFLALMLNRPGGDGACIFPTNPKRLCPLPGR